MAGQDVTPEGEVVEPVRQGSASKSPSVGPGPDIPPHAPLYPFRTPIKGYCDNTKHPTETLAHSTLVAACQSDKHLSHISDPNTSRHMVCTNCHDNPPVHRLTQHEQDHMIRDKGLFPLCLPCAEWWCNRYGMSPDVDGNNCTCQQQFPQWLCADCWVEIAKARSCRRDGCERCGCAKMKVKYQGAGQISQTVRMCSGCQGLVIKHDDEDDDYGDNDEDSMSISRDELSETSE
ncbi:unnamed protein product [Aureobasidium mustum]|uniref:Uncharacterized protein n=1 Tax=Aureobasidium mustum TaxID=2773714 RepID=A0A9N8JUI6_9PEZI|nr:unnamed protein product [Aureobasidium mustum]